MASKKGILADLLATTGISSARLALQSAGTLVVLAYHRVMDLPAGYRFDPDLVSASTEDFGWQMDFVKERFQAVNARQIVAFLDDGVPLPRHPIWITFDDGFNDNYHHAFPVLQSRGLTATIFVSTGYLGKTTPYWFDWLYWLCREAAERRQAIPFAGQSHALDDAGVAQAETRRLFDRAKRLDDARLRDEILALQSFLGVELPAGGFPESMPMTWDQARLMVKGGIEFGSHGVSHPVLANVDADQLDRELAESKAMLEAELGVPAESIAYPVGGQFAFNEGVIAATRRAGYRLATSYVPGVNALRGMERFALKRLHIEHSMSRNEFKAALAFPGVFA